MTRSSASVQVAISVDVEEDGLGCGRYPRTSPGVTNVMALKRLEFATRDFGIPLTLLATHPVIMDGACAELLARWHDRLGAEIGVHLHPWNTPPFSDDGKEYGGNPTPLDAEKMAVLRTVIEKRIGTLPMSFRMGRFAISDRLFDDIQRMGFQRDASVVPFHVSSGALAAYSVPPVPYCLRPAAGTSAALWEIPLTNLPIWPRAGCWMAAWTRGASQPWRTRWQRAFQRVGVVGLHPAWFSLPVMRGAAQMQVARGGRLLHIFLHSSDLAPGCTPAIRTEFGMQRMLDRLDSFLRWLHRHYSVSGVTLGTVSLE